VDLGVQASLVLNRDSELVRFSIHKSALIQLESIEVEKAEVEARIALDDFTKAQALANAAGLKEDRLHLLSVIAKGKIKRGLVPEPELIDSINALYKQIDRRHLGARALEIACDLVYSIPTLAAEMVEEASLSKPDSADVAIAALALSARRGDLPGRHEDIAMGIREKIRSPQLKRFINEASVRTRDTSAREILAQIEQINSAERKLFFLRQWAAQNRRRSDAWEVVQAALGHAIRAAEYTPNAHDMRQIASPLPFVEDAERLQNLVGMFAANKGNFERYGPTVDYVCLLLLMARCEFRHDKARGRTWFEEAYLYMSYVADLAVKAECFARLCVSLDLADQEQNLEHSDKLHSLAETGLNEAVRQLRDASALHDIVFSGIIRALVATRFDAAIMIANSLNTESRRDEAVVEVLDAAMGTDRPPDVSKVREVITTINDPEDRDDAVFKVLDRVFRRRAIPSAWDKAVLQFMELT
jgi:hypothetical protein